MSRPRKFLPGDRLLRLEEVTDVAMLSKSAIYRLMGLGLFPRPIKIGARRVAWLEDDITQYINYKINSRDNPNAK